MWHYILETEDYYASLAISPDPENFRDSDMCFSTGATPTDEQGAMFAEALNVHEATGLTPAQLQARVAELEGALAAWQAARSDLFAHCLSNGVFNAWQQPFNCLGLNDAHEQTERVLNRA